MHEEHKPWWAGGRSLNPLIALLIAAVATVGAIVQCGLLLDSAAAGGPGDGLVPATARSDAAVKAALGPLAADRRDPTTPTRVSQAN